MEYTVNLGKESLRKIADAISGRVEVEPLQVTENGEYTAPEGKAYSPVSVNVTGGGGSSDFSTAEVTIVNTVPANTLIGAIVTLTINGTDYTVVSPVAIDNNKCTIPLINKSAIVEIHISKPQEGGLPTIVAATILSVEGEAEIVPEYQGAAKIMGNCTITIGDAYTA